MREPAFRLAIPVTTVLLIALYLPLASAQWPQYYPASVPKNADGTPNLTAPAPRLANGKPDFSGVWMNADGGGRGAGPAPRGTTPVLRFNDLATAFPDGLPFQPWAKELRDKRNAEESKNNPDAHCLPMGFAQFHAHPYPRKMLHNPEQLTIFYEVNYGLREIFTDGRPLPSDPQPTWYGYSIGKWEGDTLVVETMGLRGSETSALDGWLDVVGSPYTDAVKTIERFRRPNYGTLEIDLTVDDPKAYTRPWTVRVNQRIQPGMQMIEFICLENNNFTKYLTGEQIREQQARDKK